MVGEVNGCPWGGIVDVRPQFFLAYSLVFFFPHSVDKFKGSAKTGAVWLNRSSKPRHGRKIQAHCKERKTKSDGWKEYWQVGQAVQENTTRPLEDEEVQVVKRRVDHRARLQEHKQETTRRQVAWAQVPPTRRDLSKTGRSLAYECKSSVSEPGHSKLHHVLFLAKGGRKRQANRTICDSDPVVGMGHSRQHGSLEKTKSG